MIHNSRLLACWILFTGRDEWLALWTNRSTAGRRRAHVSTSNSVAAFSSSTAARRLMRLSYWAWVMLTAMARGLDGLSRRQGARSRRRVCRESVANWAARDHTRPILARPCSSHMPGSAYFVTSMTVLTNCILLSPKSARFFKSRIGLPIKKQASLASELFKIISLPAEACDVPCEFFQVQQVSSLKPRAK